MFDEDVQYTPVIAMLRGAEDFDAEAREMGFDSGAEILDKELQGFDTSGCYILNWSLEDCAGFEGELQPLGKCCVMYLMGGADGNRWYPIECELFEDAAGQLFIEGDGMF